MTLIVGIKCSDGVVLGSDGGATLATALTQIPTTTQPTPKLDIIGEQIILGVSGPISLAQAYFHELEPKVKNSNNLCPWNNIVRARDSLQESLWKHAKIAWEHAGVVATSVGINAAITEANHQTVVAFPIGNEACLIQCSEKCHPEEASNHLPFLSIGSAQLVADPFLAFIRRTFWPKGLPTLDDGIFAVLWTLDYAIRAKPGKIEFPIQITVLRKEADKWKARELSENDCGEHNEAIKAMQDAMPKLAKRITTEPPATLAP